MTCVIRDAVAASVHGPALGGRSLLLRPYADEAPRGGGGRAVAAAAHVHEPVMPDEVLK